MKTFKSISFLALALALAVGITGCGGKRKPGVTQLPGSGTTGTGTGGTGTGTEPGVPGVNVGGNNATATSLPLGTRPGDLPDPNGLMGMTPDREAFKAQTVYFEYDLATVREGEKSKIDTVAKGLKDQANTKIQIEGHCDERGTEEYNRSLGERRALALREYLINSGVEGSRVFTLSFGEDKPAAQGHNEATWSKNRRGEFILYRPKAN